MIYAGFWRRFAAHMIDYCIQVIAACVVMVFVGFAIGIAVGVQKAKDKHAITSMLHHVAPFSISSPAHAEEPSAGAITPMPATTEIPSTSSLTPVAPNSSIVVPQPGTHGAEPDPMPSDAAESLDSAVDVPQVSPDSTDGRDGIDGSQPLGVTASPKATEDELIDRTTANIITAIAYAFAFLLGIVYHTCFIASSWQATPGKRAMGCMVVNKTTGGRLTYLQAFCRHLACAVSGMTFCIGYMLAGWTKESTALHDMICGTRVVRTRMTAEIITA